MADTDNTSGVDNGGVQSIRQGDKQVTYRTIGDLLRAQRNQDKRAGTRRTFTRGIPKGDE